MNNALTVLEGRVHADLARPAHPDAAWLTPKLGPDDRPALDVLVVGAGQSGLATAFRLTRSQVSNILVLDKSEEGQEGPWLTYARMHTLRSPKHFTGPDLDNPSLTYQSWHEARFRGHMTCPRPWSNGGRRPSARSGERCSVRSWNGSLIPIMLGITAKPGWHIPCFKLMFSFRK
jgi:hypothetical protein